VSAISDLFESLANDNDRWAGIDLDGLPKTGQEAREDGIQYYFTGEECVHGHISPKYTKGGRCVDCAMFQSATQNNYKYGGARTKVRANIRRILALGSLRKQYVPERPCKHGHMLRWTASNNCVECDAISRDKHREASKEQRLIKEYGITFADRSLMAKEQGYKCPICGEEFTDTRTMHVDHCHESGRVRGLLCALCNQAIGLLKDTPSIIRRAADYVELHAISGRSNGT